MKKLGMMTAAVLTMAGCPYQGERPEPDLVDARVTAIDGGAGMLDSAAPPATQDATVTAPIVVDSGTSAAVVETLSVAALDVLFVIDNSGSMASEQQKLAREIPRMVQVLTSGDRYAGRESEVPPGITDKARRFAPVRSLHLGVVSTNFGGILQPTGSQEAVLSCDGTGDDGVLQNSTEIAVEGVKAKQGEFVGYPKDGVVIAPDKACDLGTQPAYQEFVIGRDPGAVGRAFSCVAKLGVRGCPFEQPLESMWNALAPSTGTGDLYTFYEYGKGQGDRANKGFLRDEAALAIVLLTDEDDCSITTAGRALFGLDQEADETYGPLNLRCMANTHDGTLVRGLERYRDALHSLKPQHPERVLLTAITGLPLGHQGETLDELLALPEMQYREAATTPGFPLPVCSVQALEPGKTDEAYPARRLLQLQKLMPQQSVFESICAESYAPVIDRLVDKVAPLIPN